MSELLPCPECQRHVRKTETRCPFCGEAISLAHLPAHPVPRKRLGRAATFAFGASVVGATALVACGETEANVAQAVYGAPPSGAPNGGSSYGGGPVYGAPPSGAPNGGSGGIGGGMDHGGAVPVYGAPTGGTGGVAPGEPGGAGGAADAGAAGADAAGAGGTFGGGTLYGGPPI